MNVDKRKTQVEVLAPAGSLDIMKAVVAAGADAIYLGGNMFGARAFANNFNDEELICAIEYAHLFGRKVYLTVNTLLKSREIENSLIEYLIPFYEAGLDAVIVQDMGVFNLIRKHFPDMDIHASTQMTQTGVYGSRLLKELGATRIVTSREMNLQEIKQLHERLDVEIESFVHGALCYCYSGQCLLSSFNGGRSGNRGRCAQPCRMPYDVYDNGEKINNRNNSYALSPKDMCALQILPDVIESGVYSLKIEGRMKRPEYVAIVTRAYRTVLNGSKLTQADLQELETAFSRQGFTDGYYRHRKGPAMFGTRPDKKDIDDLSDIYNRGAFTTGYYDSVKGKKMMSLGRPNHMGTECLKVVSNKAGRITFKALKNVNRGDVFEIDKEHSFESGADVAAGQTLVVNLPKKYPLYEGRIFNRMNNAKIKAYVADNYVGITPKLHVDMRFVVRKNENISLTVMYDGIEKTCTGEIVTEAQSRPASEEELVKNLKKTGDTCFVVEDAEVQLDDGVFVPVGWIKELRRNVLEQLETHLKHSLVRTYNKPECAEPDDRENTDDNNYQVRKAAYLHDIAQVKKAASVSGVESIYLDYKMFYMNDENSLKEAVKHCQSHGIYVYMFLPHILKAEKYDKFKCLCEKASDCGIDRFVCRNIEQIGFLGSDNWKKLSDKVHIITDSSIYIFNTFAKEELRRLCSNAGVILDRMTLPLELTDKEMKPVIGSDTELVVYGNVPLMVSEQCVRRTYGRCDGSWGSINITGPKGSSYTVESMCEFCYSVMNGEKLNLTKENPEECGVCVIRYEFDESEADDIQLVMTDGVSGGTTGHFHQAID